MPRTRHMTRRARWYLGICSTRHLIIAGCALAVPASFQSTSFVPMIEVAPLWAWGLIFFVAGSLCAHGAMFKSPSVARMGLMWSATSTAVVAAALIIAWFSGDLSSPTGPVIWAAVAFKDFTVCADPLRSPFEEWAEELADQRLKRRGDTRGIE